MTKMESERKEELKKQIEAVLFAAGRKVPVDELAKLCKARPEEIKDAVPELKKDYDDNSSPMFLTEELDGYKLMIREKYLPLVKDITPHTELNRAMLETLAVIAWKQPVMQSEVINIRTSKAYEDIKGLVDMGFISKDKHGRSYILKPTGKFFEYFELPGKDAVKEIFKGVKGIDAETQMQLEEGEAKRLGGLEIFEEKGRKAGEEESEEGPAPKLGDLEVFTEEEEKKEAEETEEETGENEESGQIPEEVSGETGEEAEATETQEDDTEEPEEEASEETKDEPEEAKEEKEEKKHRLPKELEEFAGIDDEEENSKKGKEEKEDDENPEN